MYSWKCNSDFNPKGYILLYCKKLSWEKILEKILIFAGWFCKNKILE